ncbi:MAG TPA: hypothetical protein VD931_05380 [Baekduia sp.]|nr:hypothetical protein [Baekduia sp.]
MLTSSPVTVSVRAPAGAKVTRVLLNGRSVKSSLRARSGRLTGRVTRRSGLRYGRNTLVVKELRSGRRVVRAVHHFFLVRRTTGGMASVAVSRGVPLDARIRLTSRAIAKQPMRKVRAWLNGVDVTRDIAKLRRTRYALSLSATHGLRHGTNSLRVSVTDLQRGRQSSIERRFSVRRDAPLASAGRDRRAQPGVRIRLAGGAKAARKGTVLRHRWVVVRRPRGSRARIVGATTARPSIVPDRSGRYVLRQNVNEVRRAGRSFRQVGGTARDEAEFTAGPLSALMPVSVNAFAADPRRITIGDRIYDHRGKGATIQWLTLDRATLDPVNDEANTWCCEDQGGSSLAKLTEELEDPPGERLVIIAIPPGRITLAPTRLAELNKALALIGVSPLTAAQLADVSRQLVILGIPGAPHGTGWIWQRDKAQLPAQPGKPPPTQGWLMQGGTTSEGDKALYRFQPLRLSYDTKSGPFFPGTNSMTIAGVTTADAQIPDGTGGFHVVEVDPRDMGIVGDNNRVFVTNRSYDPEKSDETLDAMSRLLSDIRTRGNFAAVQSIGKVGYKTREWGAVSDALAKLGANPHGFNFLDPDHNPGFAFFGGPPLSRDRVAESTSNLLAGTTSEAVQPGALSGYVRMRHDGLFEPASDDATSAGGAVYDAILRPGEPWPHTTGPEAGAYEKAMAEITSQLTDFKDSYTDVRAAYTGLAYDTSTQDFNRGFSELPTVAYPGDQRPCTSAEHDGPGVGEPATTSDPPYNRDQFCDLINELKREFDWIGQIREVFQDYEVALDRASKEVKVDLVKDGEDIRQNLAAPGGEIVTSLLYLLGDIAEIGGAHGAPFGLFASVFEIGSYIAEDQNGEPLSEQISAKADELTAEVDANVGQTADTLDEIQAAAITDHGRLSTLGELAKQARPNVVNMTAKLKLGVDRYFTSTLIRAAYPPRWLKPVTVKDFSHPMPPAECYLATDIGSSHTWGRVPEPAWIAFRGAPDGQANDRQTLVLSKAGAFGGGGTPPEELTEKLFTPTVGGGGYGLEKAGWFWELGDPQRIENCYPR